MRTLRLRRHCVAILAWMALLGAIQSNFADSRPADAVAIRSLLKAAFEKPDAPLSVEPIVVGTAYAVAGWRQQDRGGRALLRQHHGIWSVVVCSGDPLRHAAGLVEAGVSEDEARRLASDIATAEAALDPHARHLLSTFEGTVDMSAHPHHP